MYNSQYYTCEQIDERLLQGYLDDYNTQTGQSLTKAQFLTKLGSIFSKEGVIDNTATQIGYYECDTAAGTAAKAITVANYALFAGGSMKVKFANKNTANNATLNINSQGAKALYYQGERASATNSWDANEVVEIYYDGTSYYANNVKGGSGSGVYDVSKEHPTSGPNSDGKFTLEYILNSSNVNELIPVNKRYPGMTIQFVSTSDNNYIQARLMTNSFTADVTKWQTVDAEPTAGSHNLVESGGVAKITDSLGKEYNIAISSASQQALQYAFKEGVTYKIVRLDGNSSDFGSLYLSKNGTTDAGDNRVQTINVEWVDNAIIFTANADAAGLNGYWTAGTLKLSIYGGTIKEVYDYINNIKNTHQELLLNNCFIGNGNTFVSQRIYGIVGGTYYKLLLRTGDFNLSEVTESPSSLCFGVYSSNGSQGTALLQIPISELANIKKEYIIKIPNDSQYLVIGGRSNNGVVVHFSLISFESEKIAYFTNAAVPTFNLQTTNKLIVSLPNETLRFYSKRQGGIFLQKSLSGQTRDFELVTLKALIYDYDSDAVKMADLDASHNCEVLLFACGSPTNKGNVGGLLAGYYYAWINDEKQKSINSLTSIQASLLKTFNTSYTKLNSPNSVSYFSSQTLKLYKDCLYRFTFIPRSDIVNSQSSSSTDDGYFNVKVARASNEATLKASPAKTSATANTPIVVEYCPSEDIEVKIGSFSKNTTECIFDVTSLNVFQSYGETANGIVDYYNKHKLEDILNLRKNSDFTCMFFSDVHAADKNVSRIIELANAWKNEVNCVINGGDTVQELATEGLSWYNTLVNNCEVPILNVAGNHDCWTNGWVWASGVDVYNLITAEVAAQAGITQPTDAATLGLNYYYKDFGNVRIICLLAMERYKDNDSAHAGAHSHLYFDSAQLAWFNSVLEDARTKLHYYKATEYGIEPYQLQDGDVISQTFDNLSDMNSANIVWGNIYAVRMSVIAVSHAPFDAIDSEVISEKLCSWRNYTKGNIRTMRVAYDGLMLDEQAVSAVNNYIENGGSFICWLTGHTHTDAIVKHNVFENQLMINIGSARYNYKADGANPDSPSDPNYDLFDYMGVDLKMGYIKVLRIGYAQDSSMRIRRSWCYDYVNQKLLSEN